MKPENAIEVKNITKKFKVYFDKGNSLKEKILFHDRNRHEEHWVLKGISFEVKKGEAIGLIGKNGCGKSTTLKMLTKIMYPTEGSIEMRGRVSSLIELGAGFHPDMTGRENIFTNASIFGLNHKQIEQRLEEIIKFSELEEFIDNPVRTYSSGMYMRLAFAVAINVDADILLIDEILAVGDVSFQAKCFEKLKEIKKNGTTIVIVSHVMSQIENICDRAIWIEEGLICEEGKPHEVGTHYLENMEEKRIAKIEDDFQRELLEKEERRKNEEKEKERKREETLGLPIFCRKGASRRGNMQIQLKDGGIFNSEGKQTEFFKVGEHMEVRLQYITERPLENVNFIINITREDGVYCFGTTALSGLQKEYQLVKGKEGTVTFVIESNNLLEGKYYMDIGIQNLQEEVYDYISSAMSFRIRETQDVQQGLVYLPGYWKCDGKDIRVD